MEKIDSLDRQILEIISQNARIPFKDVAAECGVSRCSKISFIVQNDEKEKTPISEEMSMSLIKIEPMIPAIPKIRKIHQQRVPQ